MEINIQIDNQRFDQLVELLKPAIGSLTSWLENYSCTKDAQPELPQFREEEKKVIEVENKQYSFEEVRKILTEKSRSGFTNQVKTLVSKYGDGKLSSVKPENFNDLVFESQFFCREPYTKEEVAVRIDEIKNEGYEKEISEVFEHHFATSLDDLKAEYYPAFMRDAWRLDHAWK